VAVHALTDERTQAMGVAHDEFDAMVNKSNTGTSRSKSLHPPITTYHITCTDQRNSPQHSTALHACTQGRTHATARIPAARTPLHSRARTLILACTHAAVDAQVVGALTAKAGDKYAAVCSLAYRQTLAATKLVGHFM
jgi:hypothetical protein